jgi:hypothetical protein
VIATILPFEDGLKTFFVEILASWALATVEFGSTITVVRSVLDVSADLLLASIAKES